MMGHENQPSVEYRTLNDAYSKGILSKDLPTEFVRLRALETWLDPMSKRLLEELPIQPGWHCLEMGAGAGSIAYWMAERCPSGRVIAADIDPRFLHAHRATNLQIAAVDLVRDDFPKGSFDLIHARLVLTHLPQREEILSRAVEWLKPGGSIVLEEYYFLPLEDIDSEEAKSFYGTFLQMFVSQGANPRWGREIPSQLASLGIGDLRVAVNPLVTGIGSASADVWWISLQQCCLVAEATGLLTPTQIAAHQKFLKAIPVDIPSVIVSVSGRRL